MNKVAVGSCILCLSTAFFVWHSRRPWNSIDERIALIDTDVKVQSFLDAISSCDLAQPSLFCDLEGVNLGRDGSISIFTIYVRPLGKTFLLDVHTLSASTFTTKNGDETSLRTILENARIPKVFFDVRNDSDALFAHYSIALGGIIDLQLMELGARYGSFENRKYVSGLAKCIQRHSTLTAEERVRLTHVKQRGAQLFAPQHGGRFEVFNDRPLTNDVLQYCVSDVTVLPNLLDVYDEILRKAHKREWRKRVEQETVKRVQETWTSEYSPSGPLKVLGPWQG